jgi:hypothetical protein
VVVVKPSRRSAVGARVSKRLLRWPSRNYFAELEPRSNESHPVDDLMGKDPALRRIRARARRLLARVQKQANTSDLLDFEAERNHLDAARVEVAYNLGFESGLVMGRAEGLHRRTRRSRDRSESMLVTDLRRALESSRLSPARTRAVFQELACAFSVGVPLPGRRPTGQRLRV